MKMRYSLGLYSLMALVLPFSKEMAVSSNAPSYTHYIYMFAHAGWLHFLLNAVAWAFLWQIITPARTLIAYLTAAAVSFALVHISTNNVIGWSVIIYWYWGFVLAYLPTHQRRKFLALILISFFIPNLAATWHATMLLAGYVSRKLYNVWLSTKR